MLPNSRRLRKLIMELLHQLLLQHEDRGNRKLVQQLQLHQLLLVAARETRAVLRSNNRKLLERLLRKLLMA